MLLLSAAMIFGLFKSLHSLTKHGQESKVPNVTGHQLKLALRELDGFEVHIDSIYIPYKDPLEIIYQEPAAGSIVKSGRIIVLSVNKIAPPTIAMPKLVDLSFRNAVLTLQSYRLTMGDTIFKPDLAAGAVLQQLMNGKEIAPGTQIPYGSVISLVVGAGLSDSSMAVPDFIGKPYGEALATLRAYGIEPNVVWDGTITDTMNAIVYEQFPESKNELDFVNYINPGELMDLRVMQKPSAELLQMHRAGSQRYIDPNDTSIKVIYGPPPTEEVDSALLGTTPATQPVRKPKPKPKTTQEEIDNILRDGAQQGNTDNQIPESYDPKTDAGTNPPPPPPKPQIIRAKDSKPKPADDDNVRAKPAADPKSTSTSTKQANVKQDTKVGGSKSDVKTTGNKPDVKADTKTDTKQDAKAGTPKPKPKKENTNYENEYR